MAVTTLSPCASASSSVASSSVALDAPVANVTHAGAAPDNWAPVSATSTFTPSGAGAGASSVTAYVAAAPSSTRDAAAAMLAVREAGNVSATVNATLRDRYTVPRASKPPYGIAVSVYAPTGSSPSA